MNYRTICTDLDKEESHIIAAYTVSHCSDKLMLYSSWLDIVIQYKKETEDDESLAKKELKIVDKTRSRIMKLQTLVQKHKSCLEQREEKERKKDLVLQAKEDQRRIDLEEKERQKKQKEASRITQKEQSMRDKQLSIQEKAMINLTKYASLFTTATKKDTWANVNGSILELTENVNAQKVGWIATHWDRLVEANLIGRAYDPKTCQYIPDAVYKRQFLEAVSQLNVQDFPIGSRSITYRQAKYNYGRMISRSILGCQGISRPIRHTILKNIGYDYDFANAHPQIFYQQICLMGLDCPNLTRYITDRDYLINKEIEWNAKHSISITRDHVKKSYLARLNGGSGDITVDGNKVMKIKAHKAFDEEINRLHTSLFEYLHNTNLQYEQNAAASKGEDGWNITGSTVNHWLCDMENRCLWTMYNTVKELGFNILVLCFDGMIISERLNSEHLKSIENDIYEAHKLRLNVVEKDMDEGFDIPEDELTHITRQNPCFKFFDWKYFDETNIGGTDSEIAHLLKPMFKSEYVITHDSDSKGLTFDSSLLLYKEFSTRCLVGQVSNLINDAAKKAFLYHLDRLKLIIIRIKDAISQQASDEFVQSLKEEKDQIEATFNTWKRRVDDHGGWGNFNKSNSVAKLLAQELYQPRNELTNSLNIREPFVLPVKGGMCVDLRDGSSWIRTSDDWFDYECNVSYTPWDDIEQTRKEELLDYINTMFTDNYETPRLLNEERQEYIDFIQALFGYSLTLSTEVRKFYLITGGDEGSNGKSKWFGALEKILGLNNRFVVMQRTTVIDNGKQQTHFNDALYAARNASIGFISEMERDNPLKADIIKSVTGNDTQSGELKHKSGQVSYFAHYKLFMAFNMTNMPRLNGEDNALWDRIQLILFPHRFDPRDKVENDKKVNTFYKNIDIFFSWLVEGCKKWYSNKNLLVDVPRIVKHQTSEFRLNADYVVRFLRDDTETPNDDEKSNYRDWHAKKDHVYHRYEKYCDKNKVQAMGQNTFYKRMQELGYQEHRIDNIRVYLGFKLRYDYNTQ